MKLDLPKLKALMEVTTIPLWFPSPKPIHPDEADIYERHREDIERRTQNQLRQWEMLQQMPALVEALERAQGQLKKLRELKEGKGQP